MHTTAIAQEFLWVSIALFATFCYVLAVSEVTAKMRASLNERRLKNGFNFRGYSTAKAIAGRRPELTVDPII
jgi:hypothetical protein